MYEAKTVKDLMLPLSEYAVVREDATLLEALNALDDAQKRLPTGSYKHRAVLVKEKNGKIVGKLGHYAFLRALYRSTDTDFQDKSLRRAGVSEEMMTAAKSHLHLLQDDCETICEKARFIKIKDVMHPVTQKIKENASVEEALKMFAEQETLSLLVVSGVEVTGILRLSDFFDEIAGMMKNY